MTTAKLLCRMDRVLARGPVRWIARCPAHEDQSPSLSIREADGKILLYCFSGCRTEKIVAALGLAMRDLFTASPISQGHRPTTKPQKIDLVDVAYQFELAALDRRLRADRVLKTVGKINGDELSEEQRDRLMDVIARTYDDRDRAEFLEIVADDLRVKAFRERTKYHAA